MDDRGVGPPKGANEGVLRVYMRWTRRVARSLPSSLGGSAGRPRRVRVVLDDPAVTVLSAATLARIAAEDAAAAGTRSHV